MESWDGRSAGTEMLAGGSAGLDVGGLVGRPGDVRVPAFEVDAAAGSVAGVMRAVAALAA